MYINQIYELSMVLDNVKFHKLLNHAHKKADYLAEKEDEYVDQLMADNGITVTYRDSQYKKKIKVVINAGRMMDYDKTDPDKFLHRLDKRLGEYFNHKYNMDDFCLSGAAFITDMNVGSREGVPAYLRVLQRVGKVKGFKLVDHNCFEDSDSLCWEGISNGITFFLYDLEGMCRGQFEQKTSSDKQYRKIVKETEGILRAEVRLTKPKAIRAYTDRTDIREQIANLMKECNDIFLEIFAKIVPFGNFYKKDKAVEIICGEIGEGRLRRRMLRLVALIPEKKSLYLAQKAMDCRNTKKVMKEFAQINVSPVTISKRQDVRQLKNIYEYILQGK